MATRKLVSKHVNVASNTYVGRDGELWVDTVTNTMKISDGTTPGGATLTTDGGAGAVTWAAITNINNANGPDTVAIGRNAGSVTQGTESVAIGDEAGKTSQGNNSVAIGNNAGETSQGESAVAVGDLAGNANQATWAVAVGVEAGKTTQGSAAVAVGIGAGNTTQGSNAVAVGGSAGGVTQGGYAVAIGGSAGNVTQGNNAVAVGNDAGRFTQGADAVAVGHLAGYENQAANSIVLNATGLILNNIVEDVFVVKPIRNATMTTILGYDVTTGEVTHNAAIPYPANAGVSWDGIRPTTVDGAIDRLADYTQNFAVTNAGDWNGTAPASSIEAIDRLAAVVKALNGGVGA